MLIGTVADILIVSILATVGILMARFPSTWLTDPDRNLLIYLWWIYLKIFIFKFAHMD